jgi:hypothetical protein
MKNSDLKELFFGHVGVLDDNANVLQTRREPSRVQARDRSNGSDVLDYTPFEEVRNKDHDPVRSDNRRPT